MHEGPPVAEASPDVRHEDAKPFPDEEVDQRSERGAGLALGASVYHDECTPGRLGRYILPVVDRYPILGAKGAQFGREGCTGSGKWARGDRPALPGSRVQREDLRYPTSAELRS